MSALALLALSAACAGTGEARAERGSVPWLVAHGRYKEAVELAAERRERRPQDERALEEHRLASTAWLLERGRRLYFEGRDEEALEVFREAQAIAPASSPTEDWIGATLDKLAARWFEVGLELHVELRLDEAVEAYERALSYRPGHRQTREALARVLVQQNYRAGMGTEYYDEGIVALDRYFLHEANARFAYALKYQPRNERAERRGEQTQGLLASQRAALAEGLEEAGVFAAARNEYRLALLLEPQLEVARRGLERMQREERVAERLREAERLLLRGRFDEAEAEIAAARSSTERQAEACEAMQLEVQEARLAVLYDEARTLESDWRYAEAVEAYDRLLEAAPFYRDAIARRDTLDSYVREAEAIYARYEATQSDAERRDLLLQIAVFWPEYRDVSLRLAELSREPDGDSP